MQPPKITFEKESSDSDDLLQEGEEDDDEMLVDHSKALFQQRNFLFLFDKQLGFSSRKPEIDINIYEPSVDEYLKMRSLNREFLRAFLLGLRTDPKVDQSLKDDIPAELSCEDAALVAVLEKLDKKESFGSVLHANTEVTNHHEYLMNTLNLGQRDSFNNPFLSPTSYAALSWTPNVHEVDDDLIDTDAMNITPADKPTLPVPKAPETFNQATDLEMRVKQTSVQLTQNLSVYDQHRLVVNPKGFTPRVRQSIKSSGMFSPANFNLGSVTPKEVHQMVLRQSVNQVIDFDTANRWYKNYNLEPQPNCFPANDRPMREQPAVETETGMSDRLIKPFTKDLEMVDAGDEDKWSDYSA